MELERLVDGSWGSSRPSHGEEPAGLREAQNSWLYLSTPAHHVSEFAQLVGHYGNSC